MALDVYLATAHSSNPTDGELVMQFSSSGYYWYLSSFWPASSTGGKVIDLYDDAFFKGQNLYQLGGALERAKDSLKHKADTWQQVIGYTLQNKEILSTVNKSIMSGLIEKLYNAVKRAEAENMEIHFIGD